jgi:threonine/homoserine/homoserine lactone efflux protein
MITSLLEGIILGLSLSLFFSFGPALFALIQTSILRGFWSGAQLAFGVFLSDLSLVVLGFLGAVKIFYQPDNQYIFGLIGSAVLVVFGIVTYTRKVRVVEDNPDIKINNPGPVTYILKGFFINISNPFVWIFWMGIIVGYTANYQGTVHGLMIFFSAALIVIFLMDVLKCFSAYKIKKYLQLRYIVLVNRVAGLCLVAFGVYLLVRTLYL